MSIVIMYCVIFLPPLPSFPSELVAVLIIPHQPWAASPSPATPPLTHRSHIMGLVNTWSGLHIVHLTHLGTLPHQARAPPDH